MQVVIGGEEAQEVVFGCWSVPPRVFYSNIGITHYLVFDLTLVLYYLPGDDGPFRN